MLGALRDRSRALERILAAPFLWLRVPPTAVTLFSLVPALAAALFVAQGKWIAALALGAGAAVLDLVDGFVARARGMVTPFGGFVDSVTDRVVDLAFLFGLGFALDSDRGWALIALCVVGAVGTSYARARLYQDAHPPAEAWGRGFERPERLLTLGLGALAKVLLDAWERPFPVIEIALLIYAIGANATFLQRVVYARRMLPPRPG